MLVTTLQSLSVLIRDQRKQRNMSQQEVADLVGLKQSTISAIENNPGNSHITTLIKVLSALNLELHLIPKEQSAVNSTYESGDEW